MKLVIVESPAKSKTIAKYLGDDYVVKASIGHVRDLPKSNKTAIDIENGFVPRYEISVDKKKVISELAGLVKKADEVILATDPDREGEAIAWHLAETLGLKSPKRVAFHEITERAIREALAHPREIDQNLRRAQEARRVLDRLVGYDLSGLIWKKVRYGLSAGRVQSPALRIIVEREREIRAFVPERYWAISASTKTENRDDLPLNYAEEPRDESLKDRVLSAGKSGEWIVEKVEEKEEHRTPKAPFTTSTLQQAGNSRLGFTPSRTMRAAQKLYESGYITYMRTDSTNLSKDAVAEMVLAISKEFGREQVETRVYTTKSKNAQEAHEAIRPTKPLLVHAGHSDDEKELYVLIRQRTLASQMKDAVLFKTKIFVEVKGNEKIKEFSAHGSRVKYQGWLMADTEARKDDVVLPAVKAGEKLDLISIEAQEKSTEPPPRYSEAGLVKELEKRDIGRPSTYASTIATILERKYVDKEGRSLKPTDTGEVVSSFLEQHFGDIISDTFTAEMEEELDDIAAGKRDYAKTLKDFYGPFQKSVESKNSIPKVTNLGDAPDNLKCPKCGAGMIRKLGKNGTFYSCAKYPECDGARLIDGTELAGPKETGRHCPTCKDGMLIERGGKYGMFVACDKYPKCKYIEKSENPAGNTGVACPMCKTGFMSERRGRFGVFYSCSNYPDCKNAIKAKPTGEICKYIRETGNECGALMMEGTKTIPSRCSDKTCPNHNPHKLVTSN